MTPTLLLLLLCLLATIYIFYRFFKSPFFHNVVLTYIAIIITMYCFTPNGFDWFYLFQMDNLFETLNLPLFQKTKVEAPLTQNVIEQLILFSKNQNLCFDALNKKLEVTNELLLKITEQNKILLQQGQTIANDSVKNFKYLARHLVDVKESIGTLQISVEATSKANIAILNDTHKSVVYLSDILVKNLESLQVLNNQFLVSSSELSKINSVLSAQNDITTNGFTAVHKALETSVSAQADLQNQLDLVKQRQTDLNYKNYVENQKLSKELESFKAETRAEIEANKPKVMVTESKINSSWFNSLFSNKPKS